MLGSRLLTEWLTVQLARIRKIFDGVGPNGESLGIDHLMNTTGFNEITLTGPSRHELYDGTFLKNNPHF